MAHIVTRRQKRQILRRRRAELKRLGFRRAYQSHDAEAWSKRWKFTNGTRLRRWEWIPLSCASKDRTWGVFT